MTTRTRKPFPSVSFDVEMSLTKETKGTYVYGSGEEDTFIPTLYIRKGAFPEGAPESIVVTVAV